MSNVCAASPVSPRSLLSADRIDIAIKWRLFRHLIEGGDPESLAVYRKHIMGRTGGREPGGWKRCAEDYVSGARELLASMKAHGFDPAHPVPVGSNGRIRNGAHRIACALALGIDVIVRRIDKPGTAAPWDEHWLRRGGLNDGEIARARADLRRLYG
jgi:hypothetical protein